MAILENQSRFIATKGSVNWVCFLSSERVNIFFKLAGYLSIGLWVFSIGFSSNLDIGKDIWFWEQKNGELLSLDLAHENNFGAFLKAY